jgi:hypothetical protein
MRTVAVMIVARRAVVLPCRAAATGMRGWEARPFSKRFAETKGERLILDGVGRRAARFRSGWIRRTSAGLLAAEMEGKARRRHARQRMWRAIAPRIAAVSKNGALMTDRGRD